MSLFERALRCVASRWSDVFGEERFFEFGEDRSLCQQIQCNLIEVDAEERGWRSNDTDMPSYYLLAEM